jgi:DNA-binding NtrC family response regulator
MKTTKNVLVCEDDPVQLKILTTLIDQAGYRSLSARTPSEAVVAARRCGVDAVLTDVQLQDGNAFDLVGDLHRFGFDAPVLMTSAYATEGMKDRARKAGAKFFFEKPFNLPQIREQMDRVLNAPRSLNATLLLVEAHTQVRSELHQSIVAAGFHVISVEDGPRAMDALLQENSRIEVLLTDLHAAGVAGAGLIRKALEINPDLHVVMMSGDASRDEIREGYEAGAASLVRKPVAAGRLQLLLQESLKIARARRAGAEERRERHARHAAESTTRRTARWIKSFTHAPSRSRRNQIVATLAMAAAALLIGIGAAISLRTTYETADRFEAMTERAMQMASSPVGMGLMKQDAAASRWQAGEQIRLMSEANQTTRRYYEGHLQEMRQQNRPQAQAPAAAAPEFSFPANVKKMAEARY